MFSQVLNTPVVIVLSIIDVKIGLRPNVFLFCVHEIPDFENSPEHNFEGS